jgi:hypothetical protein
MSGPRKFSQGKAHGIRNTVQLYMEAEFANQLLFPLRQDDLFRSRIVAGGDALLIWRAGSPPDYPLSISAPDDGELPWPADPEHDPDLDETYGSTPDATSETDASRTERQRPAETSTDDD